ncbi:MAG: Flp family type IVb pilin [Marmoricola sp.]|nr:Flp family type IVb pilin [Marmoricola sp.]
MLEFIRSIGKRRDEDGASAVEYGLLVAGIAALIVLIVFAFGGVISGVFSNTCHTVGSNVVSAGGSIGAATC